MFTALVARFRTGAPGASLEPFDPFGTRGGGGGGGGIDTFIVFYVHGSI
jgi:hypothetical protein